MSPGELKPLRKVGDFLLFACEELRTQGIYQCKSGYPVLWYTFGGYPWSRPIPRHSSWMEGMGAGKPFLSTGISPMFRLIQSVIIQEKKILREISRMLEKRKCRWEKGGGSTRTPVLAWPLAMVFISSPPIFLLNSQGWKPLSFSFSLTHLF